MADGDVVPGFDADGGIGLGDDAEHVGSGLQILDDDDADVVFGAVNQELRRGH